MRLLVSVRTVGEALLAARGGADFIDLKEPRAGALGALPVETIRAVLAALREEGSALPVSATIGDLPMSDITEIAARVDAIGACGVDYVKVGIEREAHAIAVLDALASSRHPVVPVFIADRGIDERALAHACALGFPAVMADTADKAAGSLFDVLSPAALQRFVATVRAAGKLAGLAGALRTQHLAALTALAPDFAGFRSAVCKGARTAVLDTSLLSLLSRAIRDEAASLVT